MVRGVRDIVEWMLRSGAGWRASERGVLVAGGAGGRAT